MQRAVDLMRRGLSLVVVDTLPETESHLADPGSQGDVAVILAWRIRMLQRDAEVRGVATLGVPVVPWRGPGSLDQVLRQVARRARRSGAGSAMRVPATLGGGDGRLLDSRGCRRRADLLATIVVGVVTVFAIRGPDSGAPFVLIVALTATWMIEVRPVSIAWSLVLALSVLVIHAASARAAALGDGARLDAQVRRRWMAQTGVVTLGTTALWTVMLLLDAAAISGELAVSAAAIASVAAFAVVVARITVSDRTD